MLRKTQKNKTNMNQATLTIQLDTGKSPLTPVDELILKASIKKAIYHTGITITNINLTREKTQ